MKKLRVIIIVLSILCVACGSQPCPDISVVLDYFPYYKGQELKFTNSQNNTLTFIIVNKESENAGYARRGGIGYKGNYCFSYADFEMRIAQDAIKIICSISIDGSLDKVWGVYINIPLYKELHNKDWFEMNILKKNCTYKNLNKYLEDTIIIENENNQIVKKVVIVKGKGLVSYTTADGEEWKLVE